VYEQLRREGWRVGRSSVEKAMKEQGLEARRRRAFRRTTRSDPGHSKALNIMNRQFTVNQPDTAWVADITYIKLDTGWAYLSVIIDLYSRAVVGWSLSESLSTEGCLRALKNALEVRRPGRGLLHHSDQGCQYTSAVYRSALSDFGAVASMSRRGNCWDNAVAESFFSTLKAELVERYRWKDRDHLHRHLFEYLEIYYNRERLHSSLGYRTPAERLATAAAAA
jgi:transposase InsO family protein